MGNKCKNKGTIKW